MGFIALGSLTGTLGAGAVRGCVQGLTVSQTDSLGTSEQLPAAFRLNHTAQLSFLALWFAKVSSVYLDLPLLCGGCKTKDDESHLQY